MIIGGLCFLLFVIQTALTQDNCEKLTNGFTVGWTVNAADESVSFVLKGQMASAEYIAFGLAGPTSPGQPPQMLFGDVAYATQSGVIDYYLTDKEKCVISPQDAQDQDPPTANGVCSDVALGGFNDFSDRQVEYSGGVLTARYTRALNTGDSRDRTLVEDGSTQLFIWSRGNINGHTEDDPTARGGIELAIGRDAQDNCLCETSFGGDTVEFDSCETLDGGSRGEIGQLFWTVNGDNIEVLYEVEIDGWVGVGWSPKLEGENGYAMADSYGVVGWATGGNEHIGDYDLAITGITPWPVSELSDAAVEYANSFTRIKFTRPLAIASLGPTGVTPAAIPVDEDGTSTLIYAHGSGAGGNRFPSDDGNAIGAAYLHATRDVWFGFSFGGAANVGDGGDGEGEGEDGGVEGSADCDPFEFNGEEVTMPNCAGLRHGMTIYWALDDQDFVEIYVIGDHAGSWIAFGFNTVPEMVGGDAVIGWIDGSGEGQVGDFHISGQASADDIDETGNQETTVMEVSEENGSLGIHFARPLQVATGASIPSDGEVDIIYAVGPLVADKYSLHGRDDRTGQAINFAGGLKEPPAEDNIAIDVHASLMVLGWGFFLPIGVTMARYGKAVKKTQKFGGLKLWYQVHRGVNCLGLLLTLVAWILALADFGTGAYPIHLAIGCITMGLGLLQPINAYFKPAKPSSGEWPNTARKAWNYVHWFGGRFALILGFVNICLGFWYYGVSLGYVAIYVVVAAIIFLSNVVMEIKKCLKSRERAHHDLEMGN